MEEDQEVLKAYLRKAGRRKDDQIEAYLQELPEEEYKAHLRDAQAWCDGYRMGWREAQKYLRDAPTAPPQDVPTAPPQDVPRQKVRIRRGSKVL